MVASIVAPYILSMWTAQWPCFRQHVKAACRSTTFEVFQGDFAAVNPTGGGDTTLLYENETAIIFSQCFFYSWCLFPQKIIFYFFYVYSNRVRNTLTAQERRSGDHLWPECAAARGDSAQLCEADLVASSCVAAETQEEVWRRMYDNEARWEPEQAARVCVTDSAFLTWNL